MEKWDKLRKQRGGIHVAFFSSAILEKVLCERKDLREKNGRPLFTGLLAAHMFKVFCHMAV